MIYSRLREYYYVKLETQKNEVRRGLNYPRSHPRFGQDIDVAVMSCRAKKPTEAAEVEGDVPSVHKGSMLHYHRVRY